MRLPEALLLVVSLMAYPLMLKLSARFVVPSVLNWSTGLTAFGAAGAIGMLGIALAQVLPHNLNVEFGLAWGAFVHLPVAGCLLARRVHDRAGGSIGVRRGFELAAIATCLAVTAGAVAMSIQDARFLAEGT